MTASNQPKLTNAQVRALKVAAEHREGLVVSGSDGIRYDTLWKLHELGLLEARGESWEYETRPMWGRANRQKHKGSCTVGKITEVGRIFLQNLNTQV